MSMNPGEDFGKPATRQRYKLFLFDNENPVGVFELDCISMCLCQIHRNSFLMYRNSFLIEIVLVLILGYFFFKKEEKQGETQNKVSFFESVKKC